MKLTVIIIEINSNGRAITVTGREGETLRFPYFLNNWLTDDGEVVSLTSQPPFTPRKIRGTHFC
jgi:hypothetical protein